MYDEKTLETAKKLEEQWKETINKLYEGKDFVSKTNSGIPIKPVYTPLDVQDVDFENEIGMVGSYPYMRSNYPIHYQFQPWINQPVHGYGLPEHTRERMEALTKLVWKGILGAELITWYGIIPAISESIPMNQEPRVT